MSRRPALSLLVAVATAPALLALSPVPPPTTTIADVCGDAGSWATVHGDRTAVVDPVSAGMDLDRTTFTTHADGTVDIAVALCAPSPQDVDFELRVEWSVPAPEGQTCTAVLWRRQMTGTELALGATPAVNETRVSFAGRCTEPLVPTGVVQTVPTSAEKDFPASVYDGQVLRVSFAPGDEAHPWVAPGTLLDGIRVATRMRTLTSPRADTTFGLLEDVGDEGDEVFLGSFRDITTSPDDVAIPDRP